MPALSHAGKQGGWSMGWAWILGLYQWELKAHSWSQVKESAELQRTLPGSSVSVFKSRAVVGIKKTLHKSQKRSLLLTPMGNKRQPSPSHKPQSPLPGHRQTFLLRVLPHVTAHTNPAPGTFLFISSFPSLMPLICISHYCA